MELFWGQREDIDCWMELVRSVSWNFPGLETEEALLEHRNTVLSFIDKRQAICVKEGANILGVLLFSRSHNMICCLAVSPDARRKGAATMLIKAMEENAAATGCHKMLLETARTTADSEQLYLSLGYQKMDYYGSPAGADNCLCFEKEISDGTMR